VGTRRLTFKPVPGQGPRKIVYAHKAQWPRPGGKVGEIVFVTIARVSINGVERFDVWFDNEHTTSVALDTYEKALDKAEELLDALDPRHARNEKPADVHAPDEGDDAVDLPPMEAYSDLAGGVFED